ncbi:hypothetical protein IHE44_0004085 [Lamprotornis superbus]|uniref:Lipase maturation factor n=1 Tax=Lamprotornis superbus TaxID=245042 RepID=A0A835NGB0_9PASS|nr:hypothetical protein IHE44_0004085 [Lamprotornis superbus]
MLEGLIKIRGDRCWRELTCMDYHYEPLALRPCACASWVMLFFPTTILKTPIPLLPSPLWIQEQS